MVNIKTFDQFINESENLNEGFNIKNWIKKPEIKEFMIDAELAKQLADLDSEIEWRERELGYGLWDLAAQYGGDAYDDNREPNQEWFDQKKKDLATDKKKLDKERKKVMKKIISKHPYVAGVEEFLEDSYMSLATTKIKKINAGMKSVEIVSWDMYDKVNRKDVEAYDITIEQLIAIILSFRAVKEEIKY